MRFLEQKTAENRIIFKILAVFFIATVVCSCAKKSEPLPKENSELPAITEAVPNTAENAEEKHEIAPPAPTVETEEAAVEEHKVSDTEKEATAEKNELYCTLSVRCDTILDNISQFDAGKLDILPKNGVIFAERKVEFSEGESVFDLLKREMKENKIHLEFVNTPVYDSVYIEGIANIYEFDAGELSGWMYRVNGEFPNYGCSKYALKQGDKVEFVYTCDLGKDVGGGYAK